MFGFRQICRDSPALMDRLWEHSKVNTLWEPLKRFTEPLMRRNEILLRYDTWSYRAAIGPLSLITFYCRVDN